jgi:hypothetical protein
MPNWKRKVKNAASDVILANGTSQSIQGRIRLGITIGKYKGSVDCFVTKLGQYDLILGDGWLTQHRAYLDFDTKGLVLRHGKKRITLRPRDTQVGTPQTAQQQPVPQDMQLPPLLSCTQVRRLLRKGCTMGVITVQPASEVLNAVEIRTQQDVVDAVAPLNDPHLTDLLSELHDIFPPPPGFDATDRPWEVDHAIPSASGDVPRYQYTKRLTHEERTTLENMITDLLGKGLIEPSTSPYGAPVLFVRKKDGTLRLCIDYRALNRVTMKNRYPLPRIDELIDKVSQARYFTSLDLATGYHQIRIRPEDVPKTAFSTPFGHFQWKVLIEGLTNAPATFQALMDRIFGREYKGFTCVYLDDLLVFSKTKEEHYQHLRQVLSRLREAKLHVKLPKCEFLKEEIHFLGHIVGHGTVKPDDKKVKAVEQWPRPQDPSQVRSFLGLANYFRKFIKGYSNIAWPLTDLTKVKTNFVWTDQCEKAFVEIKKALVSAPVLTLFDRTKPIEVVCDASKKAIGAVLLQEGHPVAYESRKLSPAETRYDTGNREMLAVVHALTVYGGIT